ncbi:unnamed protein product [Darwinula stevensoni]|uniref:Chaperone DnaJ C-terminal domain-containing protein n=1 Tax=Darwinula stevensoni TaxID=69355 RepID=A0A7R9A611_9CRUS|nr:unnamed protein product [Darwinula stevensoni]CAG0887764.1 unnamed protein product [Darwinula stevensoni]
MSYVLTKLNETGETDRRRGSGRPRSVKDQDVVDQLNKLFAIQEDQPPGSNLSVRVMSQRIGVAISSVRRVIKEDLKPRAQLNVQMAKRFLDILRVDENASGDEIRWGAKRRIMEVLEAYEVLCGNKRRKNHDKHREEGFQSRVTGGGGGRGSGFTCPKETFAEFFGPNNPFETFNMDRPGQKASEKPSHENVDDLLDSFGFRGSRVGDGDSNSRRSSSKGSSSQGQSKPKSQDPPIEHDLYVTLEELQEGCEKKMMITRKMTGIDGKTKQESKLLIVNIKPGCKSGTRITFEGEGDRGSRGNPTDVVFIIRDEPHPLFKREGSDIRYTAKISIQEGKAVCSTKPSGEELPTFNSLFPDVKSHYVPSEKAVSDEDIAFLHAKLKELNVNCPMKNWYLHLEPEFKGPVAPSIEDFTTLYLRDPAEFFSALCLSPEGILQVQRDTTGQQQNPMWNFLRKNRITASNFGVILSAVRRQSYPPSLYRLCEGYDLSTRDAIIRGQVHEDHAIRENEKKKGIKVTQTEL